MLQHVVVVVPVYGKVFWLYWTHFGKLKRFWLEHKFFENLLVKRRVGKFEPHPKSSSNLREFFQFHKKKHCNDANNFFFAKIKY